MKKHQPKVTGDPAHAPGKRGIGPPPGTPSSPRTAPLARTRDQPWVLTSGLVGRQRRSARRS
jgi:hypothetical protein